MQSHYIHTHSKIILEIDKLFVYLYYTNNKNYE